MDDQEPWLDCCVCETPCIPSKDGKFSEAQEEVCLGCGTINYVVVDEDLEVEEYVARVSSDEETADVGQPLCDGSCVSFYGEEGKPCRLDCPRAEGCGPLVEFEIRALNSMEKTIALTYFMAQAKETFDRKPESLKKAFDDILGELRNKDPEAFFGTIRAIKFFVQRLAPELGADDLVQEILREKLASFGFDA